uniref:Abhydrolase domain containing 6, acylglycerol lipase b n=1 Tax=Hucho hucho TaxID=62062 RepID=A0A4W5Q5R7_9TELE
MKILQGLVDVRLPHNDFYQEVFMEILGENSRYALQEHLQLITAPLQVIWGKQDQVVDVSGAVVVAEALPGCRVDLLENCGHSVVMERPRRTAKLIMEFIISLGTTSGTIKKRS